MPPLNPKLIANIKSARPPRGLSCSIIAIDGCAGAGKTALARQLSRALGGVPVIATDDFASWDNPFDWWPTFIEKALKPLSQGRVAKFQRSAFVSGQTPRELVEVAPAEQVIVDGVSASRQVFRPYLAFTIWVDTPPPERLRRGLARDGEAKRGAWERWMSQENDYVSREHPDRHADIVISGDTP